jgi:predicted helicase
MSNPPYSVGQGSENDANKNLEYPGLDEEIRQTYAARSNAGLMRNLYDSYIRAFRLASDRIGDRGIVSFVSNGSFIDSGSADGFRKTLCDEFSAIYCFNLRGNARTSGEQRQRERGNVFGEGSRTPVAITLLVKNPDAAPGCVLHYRDVGDYLTREQKLDTVRELATIGSVPWQDITPDTNGDWINLRNAEFDTFQPLGDKKAGGEGAVFSTYSLGVVTNRDAWAYNFSRSGLLSNMGRMIDFYNEQLVDFAAGVEERRWSRTDDAASSFVDGDPKKISWTFNVKSDLRKSKRASLLGDETVASMYRPFCKQWLYFDRQFNERVYQMPRLFPTPEHGNVVIVATGVGASRSFAPLATDVVPNLDTIEKGQCFPLYYYEERDTGAAASMFDLEASDGRFIRRDAITDATLLAYWSTYGEDVAKEDIFYYVYGILHAPEYRERFATDLQKTIPRIPMVKDFWGFSKGGRDLATLHLGYEAVDPWPVQVVEPMDATPEQLRVQKMRFGSKNDKTTIVYNPFIRLQNIPLEAYEYEVNGKSAIEWIMDRYQVKIDPASGIRNDPNEWSSDPRYVLDLLRRIITVSMESRRIVSSLPQLEIL